MRLGGYGGSTSGVERLFAKGYVVSGFCRTELTEDHVNDELDLVDGGLDGEEDLVVIGAQHLWMRVYKGNRSGDRAKRVDTGVPRNSQTQVNNVLKRYVLPLFGV